MSNRLIPHAEMTRYLAVRSRKPVLRWNHINRQWMLLSVPGLRGRQLSVCRVYDRLWPLVES